MRDLHFGCRLEFDTPEAREISEDILVRITGLIAKLNLAYLYGHPDTPKLYDSGVVYTPPDQNDGRPQLKKGELKTLLALLRKMGADPETALMIVRMLRGIEIFLDVPTLFRRGKGDCNELVPVRVAELWKAGVAASPYLVNGGENGRGGLSYHVVVLHPDGSVEDPSLILGMGRRDRAPERAEEIRKNVERVGNIITEGHQVGLPPQVVMQQIGEMGLLPSDGVFRSPYA